MVTLFSFSIQPPQSLASLIILFHPTPLYRLSIFIQAYTLYLFTLFQRITMLYLKQGSPPQSSAITRVAVSPNLSRGLNSAIPFIPLNSVINLSL